MLHSQKCFFNGYEYFIDTKVTILELLLYFDYKKSFFIVEYNGTICPENDWNYIYITNQDKLEIITIVGGG
jgi:thiamine biosynthesis protein ThiS